MLVDIRIHDPTWNATASERRREWRQLIVEMVQEYPRDEAPHLRLLVTPTHAMGTLLEFQSLNGEPACLLRLPPDALSPHFKEYCDICYRMLMVEQGSRSARLAALDMGKKLAHDSAARKLVTLCAPLLTDHGTARCFFSLLVSLHFDTSRMLRGHRVI